MKTQLCQELGIEVPIFAFTRSPKVVIEVSRAGGLGVLGAIGYTTDEFAETIEMVHKELDGLPFGVDVVMPAGFVGADSGGMASAAEYHQMLPEEHRNFLNQLLAEHNVPPLPEGSTAAQAMQGWTDQVSKKQVDIALKYPIKLIANALGPPPKEIIDLAHQHGVKVAALTGKVKHAKKQVEAGVDIIIAQGTEAGGHTGEVSSFVLTPAVVEALAPTPVLLAGGVGSGSQIAAALAMGAQGCWLGSLWLTTAEAMESAPVKQRLLDAGYDDTLRSKAVSGKPARQLKTKWTDAWEDPKNPKPLPMPLQFMLIAEAQSRIHRHVEATGDTTLLMQPVGQIVGRMNEVKPVAEVMSELKQGMREARDRLNALG
ncbi:MAG: NAD(P)H-dependent flavin oxidoreductase [Polyangiaceae bacterium]